MTGAQLIKLAKENNFEPRGELIAFACLALINAKIKDLESVAINTRAAVWEERVDETPKCKDDPRAPHGFDRNASHSADRYVCECEAWEPPKEWVGLTDEEISEWWWAVTGELPEDSCIVDFARAIEAKLKGKNGG